MRTKANVAVRTTTGHTLTGDQIAAICDTVAYTIGAEAKDVVVTDLVTVKAYRGDEVVRSDQQGHLINQQYREHENRYRALIQSTLSMIHGVIINVAVLRDEASTTSQQHATRNENTSGKEDTR